MVAGDDINGMSPVCLGSRHNKLAIRSPRFVLVCAFYQDALRSNNWMDMCVCVFEYRTLSSL